MDFDAYDTHNKFHKPKQPNIAYRGTYTKIIKTEWKGVTCTKQRLAGVSQQKIEIRKLI